MANPRGRVAVVGGGITGLTVAYTLARTSESRLDIVLLEADERLGGKVRTVRLAGTHVEAGPDAFLTRVPHALDLVHQLGLDGQLVAPSQDGAQIWARGRLRDIPQGLALGAPTRLLPLIRSGILSVPALARAGLEPLLPRHSLPEDPSVEELIAPRFGSSVFGYLVDPLLGGIYAGQASTLSASLVVPNLDQAARRHRSLFLALRRSAPTAQGPAFNSLREGLQSVVSAMASSLDGVDVRLSHPVTAIRSLPQGGFSLDCGGPPLTADAVVVSCPSHAAASMLGGGHPELAAELGQISHASVGSVALAYPKAAFVKPYAKSGFLVPALEHRLVVGVTAVTTKWPHVGLGEVRGTPAVMLRAAVGRAGDESWTSMEDAELIEAVHLELLRMMGLRAHPLDGIVTRWLHGMPQYTVGHAARLKRIDACLEQTPGIFLAGASYRGIGLPACIAQGRQAAEAALAYLRAAGLAGGRGPEAEGEA